MGPMTGGGRGFCAAYLPMGPGWAPAAHSPMYPGPMASGSGARAMPYSAFASPYGRPYGGFGAYSARPLGMGPRWGMGMGRGLGMGLGRGMGRGGWGMGRGRW